MGFSNIRDLLTSFSPALDYLAISSGDGRIKIWDSVSGQLQTEFSDITNDGNVYDKPKTGHLSVDYKCMKWLSLDRKKKRKLGSSLLVLGTGSGDVLALDVAAGQLKWTVSDCHPGGVHDIAFSTRELCIYTAGADGMVCRIDPQTGNMLGKFKASTKGISCMAVSPDGKILSTASAQLKVFNSSDQKKIKKFSGHPGAVRCMIFTEDGKYILSSGIGERYIAVWRMDGDKKQSASCVLAMEHPAVFVDSKGFETERVDNSGLHILAISEIGVCYTWCGRNIDELRNAKPTKVLASSADYFSKSHKGALPAILAARLQVAKPAASHVFLASGMVVKPSFQNVVVQPGVDINLNSSQDGVLLPRSLGKKKGAGTQNRVTALDRANVEDALLPIAKISDFHEDKLRIRSNDSDEVMTDLIDGRHEAESMVNEDEIVEDLEGKLCVEKELRSLQILGSKDDSTFGATALKGIDLGANISQKKIREAVLSMEPGNAYKLLEELVAIWQSRSDAGNNALQWIISIIVNHGHYIVDQEKKESRLLIPLHKIMTSRAVAVQPLLQLSGRLQLVTAQIDKATQNKTHRPLHHDQGEDSGDEDGDDDSVDERLYGDEEDDESELSSDNNS